MRNELTDWDADDGADAPGEAMSPYELQAAIAADLNELRAVGMRFLRRIDARADTPEGEEMLPQLNNAMVKVARAVRQVAVLQLEVAGLRQPGNARAPAAAPANQNEKAEKTGNGDRPCPRPWDKGDYNDYDDYSDDERRIVLRALIDSKRKTLVAAMNDDFRAAGRDDVLGQSQMTKCKMILGIPHPNLDAWLEAERDYAEFFFEAEDILPPRVGPGQPGVWEAWDADRKRCGLDRQDSS
jgi:hypothetical protein